MRCAECGGLGDAYPGDPGTDIISVGSSYPGDPGTTVVGYPSTDTSSWLGTLITDIGGIVDNVTRPTYPQQGYYPPPGYPPVNPNYGPMGRLPNPYATPAAPPISPTTLLLGAGLLLLLMRRR